MFLRSINLNPTSKKPQHVSVLSYPQKTSKSEVFKYVMFFVLSVGADYFYNVFLSSLNLNLKSKTRQHVKVLMSPQGTS